MKCFLIAVALAATTVTIPALAADVGVSVSIGQPGFYGHLDIGDFPQPRVIYRQPIIVERGGRRDRPPVYLRVPPGHAKHWSKHCREYNACGERVFFVNDDWYEREYVPRYQEQHRDRGDDRHDEGRNDDHGKQKKEGKGHGRNR
ncbi:MAG: hypothetical protein NT087_11840 [Deltaproteobacteria bacterium]|nr:hypothetical protein [Deltaproteobacteria bacterium]